MTPQQLSYYKLLNDYIESCTPEYPFGSEKLWDELNKAEREMNERLFGTKYYLAEL
jgi:hypothetical protein